jgi:hypothetical protein
MGSFKRVRKFRRLVAVVAVAIGLTSAISITNAVSASAYISPVPICCAPPVVPLYSVTMTANNHSLWASQSTILRATSNRSLSPAGTIAIRIYDLTTGTLISACQNGTLCVVYVSQANAGTHTYEAFISKPTSGVPTGTDATVHSANVGITWKTVGIDISSYYHTLGLGLLTTITATATQDVGPTPFFIDIFDASTGSLISQCGSGATCLGFISETQAPYTRQFVALIITLNGSNYVPSGTQVISHPEYVTWANQGIGVTLTSDATTVYGSTNVTATVQGIPDVSWFGANLSIYDEAGFRLWVCPSSGATCTISYSPTIGTHYLVAFLGQSDPHLPPANTLANSRTLAITHPYGFPVIPR